MNWAESGLGQELPGLEGIWGLGRESRNSPEFSLPGRGPGIGSPRGKIGVSTREIGVWEPGFSIYYLRNRLLEGKLRSGPVWAGDQELVVSGGLGLHQIRPPHEGKLVFPRGKSGFVPGMDEFPEFGLPAGDQELRVWGPWNWSGLAPQPPTRGGW
jgi:hypothetical protein